MTGALRTLQMLSVRETHNGRYHPATLYDSCTTHPPTPTIRLIDALCFLALIMLLKSLQAQIRTQLFEYEFGFYGRFLKRGACSALKTFCRKQHRS